MDDLIIYLAYTIFTVLYGNITKDNRNIMQPLCACLWCGNKNPDVNRVLWNIAALYGERLTKLDMLVKLG